MLHDKATTSQPLGRCFDSHGGVGGAERSSPCLGSRADPGARWDAAGDRSLPPPEPSSCLRRGKEGCVFRLPHGNVASLQRERSWTRVKGSSRFAHGAGVEGSRVWEVFCWTGFSVCFLIPPHHLKERARNFTTNRTCGVFHRTSISLAAPVSFLSRKGTLWTTLGLKSPSSVSIFNMTTFYTLAAKAIIAACTSVISRSLLM